MKQTTYICNKCKQPIKGYVYRIFAGEIDTETDEVADEGSFYMAETEEADLCSNCLTQIDKEIAKILYKSSRSVSSERSRKNIKLNENDINEIIEMRNNNISLENIANKFGCSPQTVQNHLIKIGYYKTNDQGDIVL